MSEENVEMFRRALDAANRGDLDGLTRDFHAEAEWHTAIANQLTGGPAMYKGPERHP